MKLKRGEQMMFGLAVLVAVAALGKAVVQSRAAMPQQPRDYYEWTEAGLRGHALYRESGCHNCHRAMGVGEVGIAPVLDGEGTRRTRDWLQRYLEDPQALVPGSAHDGRLGPDFRRLEGAQRQLLVEFLSGLRAGPASPNYPKPPGRS